MNSETARSEKLARLIETIRSKKADREAAREAAKENKTPKQSHETEGEHINKRNVDEAKPAETLPKPSIQGQNKIEEEKSTNESRITGQKDEARIQDIQVTETEIVATKTIIDEKPTALSVLPEKTLGVASNKHEPAAPTGGHSSQNDTPSDKEGSITGGNDNPPKNEVKEANDKKLHQQQSDNSSKQEKNVQNLVPEGKQTEDSSKGDLFKSKPKSNEENKANNKIDKGDPKKEEPKKEQPKKEKPKKEEPANEKHQDEEQKETSKESHTFIQPVSSQQPISAPSDSAQEKKIPYYPHQENSINDIDTQVDGVDTETGDLNFSKDVPETNTAAYFEGYGIAAGHAEDEFGGLGLIGVFEDVSSAANRPTCQQLYFFTIFFLITWYVFNMNHRI